MISIIMPAYNAEKYIAESIDSVLAQTFSDWELLVIDDGSKDDTAAIVKNYQKQDSRIIYLKNAKNMGVSETRNRGVRHAAGEWIAFLDSDDCWDRYKLEKQVAEAVNKKCDFLFTGSGFMDETGKKNTYVLHVPSEIGYRELLKQNVISCSSVMIRKELIQKYPMKGNNIHEDYAVWLQVLRERKIAACGIDEPLLIYRLSGTSKSANKKKAALMHWRVYRYIRLPLLPSCYYFCCYAYRNLKKYAGIRKSMGH